MAGLSGGDGGGIAQVACWEPAGFTCTVIVAGVIGLRVALLTNRDSLLPG
jgi:hypothetical protein